jgi:hypothetical protein
MHPVETVFEACSFFLLHEVIGKIRGVLFCPTSVQACPHLALGPGYRVVPILENPYFWTESQPKLHEPGSRTQRPKERKRILETDDHVVPFLIRQHVERLVEHKVAHGVKAEPEAEISHFGSLIGQSITLYTFVQLFYVLEDFIFVVREGYNSTIVRGLFDTWLIYRNTKCLGGSLLTL